MESAIMEQIHSPRKMVPWLTAVFCAMLMAGCGPKTITVPEPVVMNMDDSALLETYRYALKDDGITLTDVEMRALISEGEIDKGLSPAEMREVQIYFKHYLHSARPVIERFLLRGQPYINYTRQVFRERGLPEDLAFLAYVESGYNPVAVSRSNAVGIWQFMAPTGRQYGLTQDWWMDERRDPYRSTHAAADYLAKLYGDFNDWYLAVAAYNGGEGKIGRALNGTRTSNFFELCQNNHVLEDKAQLKEETKQYVPRFLAMCKIMRNAETLGFYPAVPADGTHTLVQAAQVYARPGTDLAAMAQRLGMRWDEFAAYNPAFRRYITPPDRYVAVYVPFYAEQQAMALMRDDTLAGNGWATYTIAKGDTMAKISTRTGVPVNVLRQMNPTSEPLKAGAHMRIPGKPGMAPAGGGTVVASVSRTTPVQAAPRVTPKPTPQPATAAVPAKPAATAAVPAKSVVAAAPAKPAAPATPAKPAVAATPTKPAAVIAAGGAYTVKPGDTLASIARQYNHSLTAMRDANSGLDNPDLLKVGQVINLPGKGTVTAAKPAAPVTYEVQPGDTMWGIARKFNMPPGELLALNNMKGSPTLRPGDSIKVHGK